MDLIRISRRLGKQVGALSFEPPVTHVYNPLEYARTSVEQYLEKFGTKQGRVVLLGMNPGPWGMAQTGVPFGEVSFVRDWMKLDAVVQKPKHEHPKRPVTGLACTRSEVSGARLWGWAKRRFGPARSFFAKFFVVNYCPLSFMEESGRNVTPDKLPAAERAPLFEACNQALLDTVEVLAPSMVIGIGAFAKKRAERVLGENAIPIGQVLHPSPASPKRTADGPKRPRPTCARWGSSSKLEFFHRGDGRIALFFARLALGHGAQHEERRRPHTRYTPLCKPKPVL